MATATPSGFINGLKAKTKSTDQLETDLNGAITNGIVARAASGEYATVGDCVAIVVPYTAFAVAGTTATFLIGTMPANSRPIDASIYVQVAGDNVSTLTLDVLFGSVSTLLACDGLTALPPEYATAESEVPRQPATLNVYAQAISTGANLNTMTQGEFVFAFSYNTARVG